MRLWLYSMLQAFLAVSPVAAQTVIPRGDAFMLGGEQPAAIRVTGRNTGATAVDISARTDSGTRFVERVQPGARFDRVFQRGEIATFGNTSKTQQAEIGIELNERLGRLSMRYRLPQD